jgi:uncharacterized protein YigA (DUF484 family)
MAYATKGDKSHRRSKIRFVENADTNSTAPYLMAAYREYAKKTEKEREKELEEAAAKANARLEDEIHGLSQVFGQCAMLSDEFEELEEEMTFELEISVAA